MSQVLFVHGYYGSHLYNGSKRKFINLNQVLPGTPAPRLDEWPHLDAELMETVGFGPLKQSVYKKPLSLLRDVGFDSVGAFAYDWRKSIKDSALKLLNHLEMQKQKQLIVAHSMGGLVALSALIQGKESHRTKALQQISGVVFVATPFKGLPVLFRNFLIGTPFYYNPWYLKPDVLCTYESPFQMLPETVKIKTPSGDQYLDTTRLDQWLPHLEQFDSLAIGQASFTKKIQQAADFRQHLQSSQSMQWDIPLMVVQSRGKDTPAGYEILSNGELKLDHKHVGPFLVPRNDFLAEDGDRTVLLESQFLPGDLHKKAHALTYEAGHLEVLELPQMAMDLFKWSKASALH